MLVMVTKKKKKKKKKKKNKQKKKKKNCEIWTAERSFVKLKSYATFIVGDGGKPSWIFTRQE